MEIEAVNGTRVKVVRVDQEISLQNTAADYRLIVPGVLRPAQARELAVALLETADEIDGVQERQRLSLGPPLPGDDLTER